MALTLNGSDPTGDLGDLLDAKLPIAGGKILQIVRATDGTLRSTTSASYVDVTGMTVTITPQKSTSAILLIAALNTQADWTASGNRLGYFQITDNSNNGVSGAALSGGNVLSDSGSTTTHSTIIGYSTPATTAATTYKLRFLALSGTTAYARNDLGTGQMYAMEVSA